MTPMRSAYRVVNIGRVATWDPPSILKNLVHAVNDDAGETKQLCDAQLAVDRITTRLENPLRSTLMAIERLKATLRECELEDEAWSIFESCLCMDGFMVRKHTGNATNSPYARSLPLRACCQLYERDSAAECCGLFYPPADCSILPMASSTDGTSATFTTTKGALRLTSSSIMPWASKRRWH